MHLVYEDSLNLDGEFISVSKPARVLKAVLDSTKDIVHGIELIGETDLCLVHDPDYVSGVLSYKLSNGFGNKGSNYLYQILAANGAMYTAAKYALSFKGAKPVAALCSGFHHARYASGGGFCTFNGLLVAVEKLRLQGHQLNDVLIIDGDAHYGDGTDDIIRAKELWNIVNLTHRGDGHDMSSLTPLTWRSKILAALKSQRWDLVIYQAGADCHEEDDFGAGYLTDLEWEERDYLVFSTCKKLKFPLVWNLAGGYSDDKTINLHAETFKAARQVYEPTRHRSSQAL